MKERIQNILKGLKTGTYERDEALALSLLTALGGENIFLLGLPGVAKSMMARRLKLAFKNARVFEYLMSRFSTPDEIFGPVSISKLKDEDSYERIVEGYLPDAEVVFLDEIWKAGPAIQNSLLTVLNEKVYLNGKNELRLPVKGMIAASNELPAKDEGLEALWDRFLVRYIVNPIKSKQNFFHLLRPLEQNPGPVVAEPISDDEYNFIRQESGRIALPDYVLEIIYKIRDKLNDKLNVKDKSGNTAEENRKYYVSDRRWKKAVGLMQTSAYLNDRNEVDFSDILILCHILWNEDSMIAQIQQIVSEQLVASVFGEKLRKYKSSRRHAVTTKNADKRIFTPDSRHYIVQCDDAPLKLLISDYEEMRDNPNDVYFGIETLDGTITIVPRGQFTIRFAKEGHVCINSYTYPLRTNADKQLDEGFISEMADSIDDMANMLFRRMNDNIFIKSAELPGMVSELIRLYRQRLVKL